MVALSDPEDPPANAPGAQPMADTEPPQRLTGTGYEQDIAERHTALTEVGRFRVELREIKEIVTGIATNVAFQGRENGRSKSVESALLLEMASLRGLQPNGLAGKRVLVVDDHDDFLDTCERVLGELGCNVSAASCTLEAEKMLAANPRRLPHLAIIDLHLPSKHDGVDLMRWVLSAYPGVRVIAISGYLDAAPELDELPVIRVEKPFTIARIKAAMYGALGMIDVEKRTEPPPEPSDTERPPVAAEQDFVEDDTSPSAFVQLPTTRPDSPDALRREE